MFIPITSDHNILCDFNNTDVPIFGVDRDSSSIFKFHVVLRSKGRSSL